MESSVLHDYFQKTGFAGESLDIITSAFIYRAFKKNDMVVTEGKVSRELGFVESGMYQYYVVEDGKERTTYVSIHNSFLASLLSFIGEVPAMENIRALTNGGVFMISKSNLKRLTEEVPGFKDFYIGLLEAAICGIDETRHDLIVLSAEQRYAKMLKKEPHLLQLIPLGHLASILGVTQRHLSRIRNIR